MPFFYLMSDHRSLAVLLVLEGHSGIEVVAEASSPGASSVKPSLYFHQTCPQDDKGRLQTAKRVFSVEISKRFVYYLQYFVKSS